MNMTIHIVLCKHMLVEYLIVSVIALMMLMLHVSFASLRCCFHNIALLW